MPKYPKTEHERPRTLPPAFTQEGSENRMASLALQLAEKRLLNGTASAQEIVYFTKEGSRSAQYEREILEQQKNLIVAKTDSIKASQRNDELAAEAIAAMKDYTGNGSYRETYDR